MKIKASELTGAALNWAAAKADNNLHPKGDVRLLDRNVFIITAGDYENPDLWQRYAPAIYWAQGGPIIDREMIQLTPHCMVNPLHGWAAAFRSFDEDDNVFALHRMRGRTPLRAAMRCYVASKLGDTVDIPDELL